MESEGRVIVILDRCDGVSKKTGKAWSTQSFIIETSGQYPVKQCFEVFGDDRIKEFENLMVIGRDVVVSFDLESREWTRADGTVTWFTSARAWKVESALVRQLQNIPPQQVAQGAPVFEPMDAAPEQEQGDVLPF